MNGSNTSAIERAQAWCQEHGLHYHTADLRPLMPLARLLGRLEELEAKQ